MKSYFGEGLIEFEALTETPLKEHFQGIKLDRQIDLIDGFVLKVKEYADANGMPHPDRKTWTSYKRNADWTAIAKELLANKSFLGKAKKMLDKLANI